MDDYAYTPVRDFEIFRFFFRDEPLGIPHDRSAGSRPQAVLSLRHLGDMKFDPEHGNPAREAFLRGLGVDTAMVAGIHLHHTQHVAFIESHADLAAALQANPEGFDGIITANPAIIPTVTVADCMPVWIYCRHCGAFGVLHSGWKGTGILERAVILLRERLGCTPDDLAVIFGPSIGSCCYEVDQARAAYFMDRFGSSSIRVTAGIHGARYHLDLLAANLHIAGTLSLSHIQIAHQCTVCTPRYGSFRREGAGSFTRMLAACGYFPGLAARYDA
ncbi:MAG: polyphenol oxidase family protein [Spirochaetales bacterium]|nr:polyphenol oxidase family protein [Spirochaetales bacterium]